MWVMLRDWMGWPLGVLCFGLLWWLYRERVQLVSIADLGLANVQRIAQREGLQWRHRVFERGGVTRAQWRAVLKRHNVAVAREHRALGSTRGQRYRAQTMQTH
jgi:hypothetical protein